MLKKTIIITVLTAILIGGFFAGKSLLNAGCCNDFSLNCCCADWSDLLMGFYLDDYICVCMDGKLMMQRCWYVTGFNRQN
jgi:hypothetical protein